MDLAFSVAATIAGDGCRIRIPNLGWGRTRETLRFTGKILSATISRVADRWFASITVDTQDLSHLPKAENQSAVGVDLGGGAALATLSTGEVIAGPKAHTRLLKRLRRLSRSLSRKQKGSANSKKARVRLARLIRPDRQHSPGCPEPAHHEPDAPLPGDRDRGLECVWHAEESPSGPARLWAWGSSSSAASSATRATCAAARWWWRIAGLPEQDLFVLRVCIGEPAAVGARLDMPGMPDLT